MRHLRYLYINRINFGVTDMNEAIGFYEVLIVMFARNAIE